MARHALPLTHFEAEMVLVAQAGSGERRAALRIRVFGPAFPQRALEPELWVGSTKAQKVSIARDQRSLRGYFPYVPPDGAEVRVRYGNSLEGVLEQPFTRQRVQALFTVCGG